MYKLPFNQNAPKAISSTPLTTSATTNSVNAPVTIPAGGATETFIIEISPDKVGQVIGSKGAIIQEIQMRTGAKAFVNQDFPEGVNRQVNITGTALQVKAATEMIKLIIEQGPTAIHVNSLTGGPSVTSIVECTQGQVYFFINIT
jgi:polyribonucleotide nucleotidyltransferase